MCSTPFGITDFDTRQVLEGVPQRTQCSTPFGITDFDTSSAIRFEAIRARCSTPFGITDFDTRDRVPEAEAQAMCSTPFGITDFDTTAARRFSWRALGAQRLSASLTSTLLPAARHRQDLPVLNAFR